MKHYPWAEAFLVFFLTFLLFFWLEPIYVLGALFVEAIIFVAVAKGNRQDKK